MCFPRVALDAWWGSTEVLLSAQAGSNRGLNRPGRGLCVPRETCYSHSYHVQTLSSQTKVFLT